MLRETGNAKPSLMKKRSVSGGPCPHASKAEATAYVKHRSNMKLYREPISAFTGAPAMNNIHRTNRYLAIGLILSLLSGMMLLGWTLTAQADGHRSGYREFRDSRYNHDRSYPVRGQVMRVLPSDRRVVIYGGARYYFSGGVWYRPEGSRFAVVLPPVGLFLPFLPPYYATIWVRGVPYYYADEVYYAHKGDGYVVVEPPKDEVSQTPPPANQMFIYPRLGQSEQQQADDRYACHRWAVDQTGFDPTQPPGSSSEVQKVEKRADYQRAIGACLDGRGYTVK